jgi:GTPase SAR1 family protein
MARQGLESLHTAVVWYYETYVDSSLNSFGFQPYVYTCMPTASTSERPIQKKQYENRTSTDVPPSLLQEEQTATAVLPELKQERPATATKPIEPPVTYVDSKEDSSLCSEGAGANSSRNGYRFSVSKSKLNDAVIDVYRILADVRRMAIQEQRNTKEIDRVSIEFENAVAVASEPYRLGILGAFKAGKSTLINSLAGSEIAYTDILCATCIPTGYIYSSRPDATIEFNSGQTAAMTVEEFLTLVQQKRDDAGWVNSVRCARVGYPSEFLKTIEPWDVPGIGGSETDERKALEFMDHVGGAIWVFDATALGDNVVGEPIHALKVKGVRMIAALNRIDLVEEADIKAVVGSIEQDFAGAFVEACPVSAISPGLKDGAYLYALTRTIQTGLIDSSEADRQKRADLAVAHSAQQIEHVLEKERTLHWAFLGFSRHIRRNLEEVRGLLLSNVSTWVSRESGRALQPIENKAIGILSGGYASKAEAYQALQQQKELYEAWEEAYRAVAKEALDMWESHWYKAISLSFDSVPSAEFTVPNFESTNESKAAEKQAIMDGIAAGGKAAAVAAVVAAALYIISWPVIFVGLPIGLLEWWRKRSGLTEGFDLKSEETRMREAVKELRGHFANSLEPAVCQMIESQTEKATTATIREFAKENFGGIAEDLIKGNEARYQDHVNALKATRIEIRSEYGPEEPGEPDLNERPLIISPDDPGSRRWAQFFMTGHDALDIILQSCWEPASLVLAHLSPKTRVRILTTCPESVWSTASEQLRKQTADWNGSCEIRIVAAENGDQLPLNCAWIITKSEALICRNPLGSIGRSTCVFECHPDGIFTAQNEFAELWQGKGKHGQHLKLLMVR